MTRIELQTELKALRNEGYDIGVKLNASNADLQKAYDAALAGYEAWYDAKCNAEYAEKAKERQEEYERLNTVTPDQRIKWDAQDVAWEKAGQSAEITYEQELALIRQKLVRVKCSTCNQHFDKKKICCSTNSYNFSTCVNCCNCSKDKSHLNQSGFWLISA